MSCYSKERMRVFWWFDQKVSFLESFLRARISFLSSDEMPIFLREALLWSKWVAFGSALPGGTLWDPMGIWGDGPTWSRHVSRVGAPRRFQIFVQMIWMDIDRSKHLFLHFGGSLSLSRTDEPGATAWPSIGRTSGRFLFFVTPSA